MIGEWLIEPFRYPFIQRAFLCAFLVGGLSGIVGVYVVLRRISYIGHGLSYAIFGGAVISAAIGLNIYVGATVWGVLAAVVIFWLGRQRRVNADAAIGIITTASFAVGVILLSTVHDLRTGFDAALFGNILSIRPTDTYVIIAVSVVIMLVVVSRYKPLLFTTFDPAVARVYGVQTGQMDMILSLVLAGLLIVAMQIVGVTLIAASLITPPSIARLLTHNFHKVIMLSGVIGALGGIVGVYASWHLNWATGATIVVTHTVLFGLALLYRATLLPRWIHRSGRSEAQPATQIGVK
jgi:ABC-type Mn2+/Zn2+ transport system permease subunit